MGEDSEVVHSKRRQFSAIVWEKLGYDPEFADDIIRCGISNAAFDRAAEDSGDLLYELGELAADTDTLVWMISDGHFTAGQWSYTLYTVGDGFIYAALDDDGDHSIIAVAPEAQRNALVRQVGAEAVRYLCVFPAQWQASHYDEPWFARAMVNTIWQYEMFPDLPQQQERVSEQAVSLWYGYVTQVPGGHQVLPRSGDHAGENLGTPSGLGSPDMTSPTIEQWLGSATLYWRDTGEVIDHPETLWLVCRFLGR